MSGLPKKEECVRVVVRCRPMSSKEKDDGRQKVVEMDKKRGSVRARCLFTCVHTAHHCARAVWQVVLHADQTKGGSGEPPKTFTFDQVYDDTSQQEVTRPHIPTAHEAASARRGCRTRPARYK